MAGIEALERPAIIAISSHVARGTVGNRAVVFALEVLGFPVWSVSTVSLPWHPGHGPSTRIIPDPAGFSAFLEDLRSAPWLGEVGGILTGYIGAPSQAEPIARLVNAVRAANPDAVYMCDPVIGDNGGLYVAEAAAIAIRDRLLPLADIATPNRFELEWLSGMSGQSAAEAARRLGLPSVLVTSASLDGLTGNLLVRGNSCLFAGHEQLPAVPNGSGDLTAALFLAHMLSGKSDRDALAETTGSVLELLKYSLDNRADELLLERHRHCIEAPAALIEVRQLEAAQLEQ